jgi:hypothetical protein
VYLNTVLGWPPGTAESLPSPDLAMYSEIAQMRVSTEQAQSAARAFLHSGQDDTERAQKLLKQRGEKFKLTDLVVPTWQMERM